MATWIAVPVKTNIHEILESIQQMMAPIVSMSWSNADYIGLTTFISTSIYPDSHTCLKNYTTAESRWQFLLHLMATRNTN